jgi:ABC-type phosphate transport system substrate-binding protein
MKDMKNKTRKFLRDTEAVSPAIATLILIVIAAVAAAAIGYIVMSSQGSTKDTLDSKSAGVQGKVFIDGSTTVLPVSLIAGPSFMADSPSYIVSATGGGSDIGQLDVFTKKVDIGASSSQWSSSVKTVNGIQLPARKDAIIQEAGPTATIWETAIGTGMIVIAGNMKNGAGNQVTAINMMPTGTSGWNATIPTQFDITYGDLQNLYNGSSPTAGGVALQAVQRSDQSGTEETFAAWLGKQDATTKQLDSTITAIGEQGNQGIRDYISSYPIANNKGAIGFVDIGFTQGQINGATGVIPATQNGVAASSTTKGVGKTYDTSSIAVSGNGKGLARDLYYYSYGTPTGAVKAFLDYILSSKGQDAVHAAGFFSI